MKKHRRGFTLIEVVLFLGLTSALFLGIAIGVQNSVFQQRYNDSVQSFAEFLRSVYSQVANVQNEKYGRTGKAIYGKVVTFDVLDEGSDNERNLIKTYNLLGDIRQAPVEELDMNLETNKCNGTDSVIDRLCALNASIVYKDDDPFISGTEDPSYHTVGFVETYEPRWDARIQTTTPYNDANGYDLFRGIIVITHSPSSGNISTYVLQDPQNASYDKRAIIDEILERVQKCEEEGTTCIRNDKFNPFSREEGGVVTPQFTSDNFTTEAIDFCVNPNGLEKSTIRRDIRLDVGAHNASGVQVIVEDRAEGSADDIQSSDLNRCAI